MTRHLNVNPFTHGWWRHGAGRGAGGTDQRQRLTERGSCDTVTEHVAWHFWHGALTEETALPHVAKREGEQTGDGHPKRGLFTGKELHRHTAGVKHWSGRAARPRAAQTVCAHGGCAERQQAGVCRNQKGCAASSTSHCGRCFRNRVTLLIISWNTGA